MVLFIQQLSPQRQFEQGHAFLDRASRNPKEVPSIGFGEPAVSFGNVGGDGERGTVELVDEKTVTAWKAFGALTNCVSEVDRILVDDELFEGERHEPGPRFRK